MVSRAGSRQNKAKSANKRASSQKDGFVRIIAGQWRGKKLAVKDLTGLRPTTDRIKETVFNWLMFDIADKKVLDAFAGAGSLGFEALSRGAAHVTLIEKQKQAAMQLSSNLAELKATNAQVIQQDCLSFLQQQQAPFDLIFIDPPFRQDLAAKCCILLEERQLLTDNALVYIETEIELKTAFWPQHWQLKKEKAAGQVVSRLFAVEQNSG